MIGLFLMMSSLVIMTNANVRCPDTWTVSGDSCYKFIAEKTTWFDAQVICKTANSHVVRIESRDEDNFVRGLVSLHGAAVWIGLSDLLQEGRFLWDDTQKQPSFTNWFPQNPSNTHGNEDCGMMLYDANGLWNDAPCEFKLSTICEKSSRV